LKCFNLDDDNNSSRSQALVDILKGRKAFENKSLTTHFFRTAGTEPALTFTLYGSPIKYLPAEEHL
jgi:hypothetical protein